VDGRSQLNGKSFDGRRTEVDRKEQLPVTSVQAPRKGRLALPATISLALIANGICYWSHVCKEGHMRHPPYGMLAYLVDFTWLALLVVAAGMLWLLRLRHRIALSLMIIAVTVARLYVWYNVRGNFEPFEPFLWVAMLILAWRTCAVRPVSPVPSYPAKIQD
jgi:hypothetical protein